MAGGVVSLVLCAVLASCCLRAPGALPPSNYVTELPNYDESKQRAEIDVAAAGGEMDFTPYRPYEAPVELQVDGVGGARMGRGVMRMRGVIS
jgi:hypothetical protein